MIDFQSSCEQTGMGSATVPVAAFGVSPNASPLCSLMPLPEESVFIGLPRQSLAKAGVHPWLNLPSWPLKSPNRPKAGQGYPNLPKPLPQGGGRDLYRCRCLCTFACHVPRGAFALFITPNQPLDAKLPAPYRPLPAKKFHRLHPCQPMSSDVNQCQSPLPPPPMPIKTKPIQAYARHKIILLLMDVRCWMFEVRCFSTLPFSFLILPHLLILVSLSCVGPKH
jgi:hypothetical protein